MIKVYIQGQSAVQVSLRDSSLGLKKLFRHSVNFGRQASGVRLQA